jgi:hypothetical protein
MPYADKAPATKVLIAACLVMTAMTASGRLKLSLGTGACVCAQRRRQRAGSGWCMCHHH